MGARDVRAGRAFVEVYTKDQTDRGLAGIWNKLGKLGGAINKFGGLALGSASAAGAATAGVVMKAVNTGSAIKDMADRFGLSYVAVQRLGFVADQTGSSVETLANGVKKMQQDIGNGTIAAELEKIGLKLADLQGKSPEQQFAMIATAIGKLSDPAKKTAAAMAIFGKAGSELVPLTGEIQNLMAEFDSLGVTMGDAAVEQAEALGDTLDKTVKRIEALAVSIGTSLLPIVEKAAEKIQSLFPTGQDFAGVNPDLFNAALQDEIFGTPGGPSAMDPILAQSNARAKATADRAKAEAEEGKRLSEARKQAQAAGTAVPGSGNSPLGQWLQNMGARSANMNRAAAAREQMQPGINVFKGVVKEWERIGRSVEREQNKERIRENRRLVAREAEIVADMKKMRSFGGFDKEGMLGGVFGGDVQVDQLKELKEIRRQIAANGRRRFAIPGV